MMVSTTIPTRVMLQSKYINIVSIQSNVFVAWFAIFLVVINVYFFISKHETGDRVGKLQIT